ncbi:MAG: hypothetical protein ACRCSB_03905 [Bacteroidales bacterium]
MSSKMLGFILIPITTLLTFEMQSLQAQNCPSKAMPSENIQAMTQNLDLDLEQSKKLDAIYARYASTLTTIKIPNRELMEKMNEEIISILNPEQQIRLKNMRPKGITTTGN